MFFQMILSSMKRRKKEVRFLSLAAFIIVFFLSSVHLFQNIMNRYLKETNYKNYGEWVLSSKDVKLEHPYFIKEGVCYIGKRIKNQSSVAIKEVVGSVDENFLQMANLTFYEGRMPQKKNEIAMTSTILVKLGYDAQLGQEIEICMDAKGEDFYTFTLVGIIKDFSANWESNYQLPSCIVYKDMLIEMGEIRATIYFYQLDRKYKDINISEFKNSFLEKNELANSVTYNSSAYGTTFWGSEEMFQNIKKIILILAMVILGYLMMDYVTKRRKWYEQLRGIGASKLQIGQMIFLEGAYATIPSTLIGLGFPYLIAKPICDMVSKQLQLPNIFVLDWESLLIQIGNSLGIIVFIFLGAYISICCKPVNKETWELTKWQLKRLKKILKNGREKNVVKCFWKRHNMIHPYENAAIKMVFLLFSSILVMCTCMLYETHKTYEDMIKHTYDLQAKRYKESENVHNIISDMILKMYKKENTDELIYEYNKKIQRTSYFNTRFDYGIDEMVLVQMEALDGVEEVREEIWDTEHLLSWNGDRNSPILQTYYEEMEKLQIRWNGMMFLMTQFQTRGIYGDYESLLEQYGYLFENAQIDKEAFKKGEQVFIIAKNHDQNDIYSGEKENVNLKIEIYEGDKPIFVDTITGGQSVIGDSDNKNSGFVEETTLKTGDIVTLTNYNMENGIQVEAVVLSLTQEQYWEEKGKEYIQDAQYIVFGSLALAEKIAKMENRTLEYNRISVNFNSNFDFNITSNKINTLLLKNDINVTSSNLEVTLKWEQREQAKKDYIHNSFVYGTIFIMVLTVYFILQIHFNQMKHNRQRKKYQILKQLGMSDLFWTKMVMRESVKDTVWLFPGIVIGYVVSSSTYGMAVVIILFVLANGIAYYSAKRAMKES